jgi:hypothetical protein
MRGVVNRELRIPIAVMASLIFLLLVWVGAMVHAWFAARKFNRKNGIELR